MRHSRPSALNQKLSLPNVTAICVTGVNIDASIYALWRSSVAIDFGAIKLVSVREPIGLPPGISFEPAHESELNSIDSYSEYMIYDLWRHVDTSHCLVIQADGYVIHPEMWQEEFLNYDYIGAPWRLVENAYIDPFGAHQRVGNGGFSLRSKKLLEVPNHVSIPWEINDGDFYKHMDAGLYSEDGNICVHNRHLYEAAGCTWAPLGIASKFSKEQTIAEGNDVVTFGFHKKLPNLKERILDQRYRFKFRMARW